MNSLNGFWVASVRDKHYEHCSSDGNVSAMMPSEKDGQYQFRIPCMLCTDFGSTLKPVDE